jgi:hypothetical protein
VAPPADLPDLRPRRLLRRLTQPARDGARHATSHPIIRSLEPGEDWSWCYVDEVAFVVDGIRGKTRIPPSPLLQ